MKANDFRLYKDLCLWVASLAAVALIILHLGLSPAHASLPSSPPSGPAVPAKQIGGLRITDDTALYQKISEIDSPKIGHVDFDSDLERLSEMENRYRDHKRIVLPRSPVRGKSSRGMLR